MIVARSIAAFGSRKDGLANLERSWKLKQEEGSDTFTVFRGRARPFANTNPD
jgi:hypothetical protein